MACQLAGTYEPSGFYSGFVRVRYPGEVQVKRGQKSLNSRLSIALGCRRAGNDNGGDFQKQPDNGELGNQPEDQRKKVWRP